MIEKPNSINLAFPIEKFFNIFLSELELRNSFKSYYRFLNNKHLFAYRKAYFIQRLEYIMKHLPEKSSRILDLGCGYGTSGILFSLNNYDTVGITLQYFFDPINERKEYWSQFGNVNKAQFLYGDFIEMKNLGKFDVVIAKDTLHHIEPLNKALGKIYEVLKPKGILIVCEENGENLLHLLRLFIRRRNKRVINIYDEKLDKMIQFGNENIRSEKVWKQELLNSKLEVIDESIEHIRIFPPFFVSDKNYNNVLHNEKILSENKFLRKYFFHGFNFVAQKIT